MTYVTPKNDENLSVLFCWFLGPDQPGVPRRVDMSSCLLRISHFSRQFNDVRISSIPKNVPTWAHQFCSSLSNTWISLRLTSSDLLLPLETFNKEDILFLIIFESKYFCIRSIRYVLLIIASVALSTLLYVHLCPNLPLSMILFNYSRFLCCSIPSFGVSATSPKNSSSFNISPTLAIIFIKRRNRQHMKNNTRYKGTNNNIL